MKSAKVPMTPNNWGVSEYPKEVKGTCTVCGHEVSATAWGIEEEALMNVGSFTKAYCSYCRDQEIIVSTRAGAVANSV